MDISPSVAADPRLAPRVRRRGVVRRVAILLLLLAVPAALALHEAARPAILVAPLPVPEPLRLAGMTEEVAARRLADALAEAAHEALAAADRLGAAALAQPPALRAPADGNLLPATLRHLFAQRVVGEVLAQGDTLRLRLRVAGAVAADLEGPAAEGADPLLRRAAPALWRHLAPGLHAVWLAGAGLPAEETRERLAALRRESADPAVRALATVLVARSLTASDAAAEALAILGEVAAARPGDAAVGFARADALRALGRLPEAVEAQRRALDLAPGNLPGWLAAAALLRAAGQPEEALAAAERAAALAPDTPAPAVEAARALRALGRPEEAMLAARRALRLDPGHAPAMAELGTLRLRRADPMGALALFEAVMRRAPRPGAAAPPDPALREGTDLVLAAMSEMAADLAGDEAEHRPRGERRQALRGLHQWTETLEAYEAALPVSPGSAALHLGRGVAALRLGRPVVALESLRRAGELGLDDPALPHLVAEAEEQAKAFVGP